jgi:hypothetical protein
LNATDNTLKSITEILAEFFGNELICFDAKDMTISYIVNTNSQRIALLFASQDALPKPQGVGLSGVYLSDNPAQIFAAADYTETIVGQGFVDYATGSDDSQWLRYEDKIA